MESLSLSQYLGEVKSLVASAQLSAWVRAEVYQISVHPKTGHCYISLVEQNEDHSSITAEVKATIWANVYAQLAPRFLDETGQPLVAGLQVLVWVSPRFHERFGFSLDIRDIDSSYTLGAMALQRNKTIAQLKKEGVWDMNRSLPLPSLFQRIAVISSPSAAGYGDFCHHISQNTLGLQFYTCLFPALMQGEQAPLSVMHALDRVAAAEDNFDAVAILRGGGASIDLLAFDDYNLAASCAQFPLPIISGIGHDRDESVVDLVAFQHCKTPTAVADFFIDAMAESLQTLLSFSQRMQTAVVQLLADESARFEGDFSTFRNSVPLYLEQSSAVLAHSAYQLSKATSQMETSANHRLHLCLSSLKSQSAQTLLSAGFALDKLSARQLSALSTLFSTQRQRLSLYEQKVHLLSPQTLLKKGYSLTLSEQGKVVTSAKRLKKGERITSVFADGKRSSTVDD